VLGVFVDDDVGLAGQTEVVEHESGAASVLATQRVALGDGFDGTWGEISQVADRRGDEHQRAAHEDRTSTVAPTRRPQRSNEPDAASMTYLEPRTGAPTLHGARRLTFTTTPSRFT